MCLFYRHYCCYFCCCCLVFFLLSKITSFVFRLLRVLSICVACAFYLDIISAEVRSLCVLSHSLFMLCSMHLFYFYICFSDLSTSQISCSAKHKHNSTHKCTAIVCRFESLSVAHTARATMFPLFVYTVLEMKETTECMLLLLLLPCITVYLCHERKIIHNTILNRSYAKQMQKRFLDVLV